MPRPASPPVTTRAWREGVWRDDVADQVAAEEPLQLSLDGAPLSVIMRTPGADLELALGLLWAERVITSLDDVREIHISAEAHESGKRPPVHADIVDANAVDVHLVRAARRPQRSFLASSACGVCGATTLDDLSTDMPPLGAGPTIRAAVLTKLGDALRTEQRVFERTGGLHAAGLFTPAGELRLLREDIGRHNAVDKVVGRALLDGLVPLDGHLLVVSGRGGYELAQKSVAAGITILAAVGAPSSLAVGVAQRFGMTLVGFLRDGRFNVYSAPQRIV